MSGLRCVRGAAALALAVLSLAAGPRSSTAEEPKGVPGATPDKIPLRLRLEEKAKFSLEVMETIKSYSVENEKKEEQVGQVDVRREGEMTVISTGDSGGGVVRLGITRVHGSAWSRLSHPKTSKFDSADPDWDAKSCDEWVAHQMNEVRRKVDLTLSARGEITRAAPPADGSHPFSMFGFTKTEAEASDYLRSDLQRFLPGLPEKEVGAANSWTVEQKHWYPPLPADLGPLSMKFTVLGKPGELLTAVVTDAEKRDPKEEVRVKGKVKFSTATGMVSQSSMSISVVRTVAATSDGPILNRLRYSFETAIVSLAPK